MNREQFYNINLEHDFLTILINDSEALGEVIGVPSDIFYNSKNKALYEVLEVLWKDNQETNLATIHSLVKGDIDSYGGITKITDLQTSYINSQGYKKILEALEDYKTRREVYKLMESVKNMMEYEAPTEKIILGLNKGLEQLAETEKGDEGELAEDLNEVTKMLEERQKTGGQVAGVRTKLDSLDYKINGLNKQTMIVVAGRPGQGKTTFANNIAVNVSKQGYGVAVFNLEMSRTQILENLISNLAMVNNSQMRTGDLKQEDWNRVVVAQEQLMKLQKNLKIFDSILSIDKIIAKAKKLKKQGNLDLVVVDYLQLIQGDKTGNREQEVADISRKLKLLSKELKITVIALSQLSRSCEARMDKRPILSDLRESGAIEQDADIVMFTYRDEYYNPDTDEPKVIEVIVAKQRNGTVGTVKLSWLPEVSRVWNLIRV